jgi:DNA-directed RNA polymerase subunit beta
MATQMKQPAKGNPIFNARRRIRKDFGKIGEVVQMPNLIEVQRESYEHFLRSRPADGYVSGLEKTLRSVFPIRDFAGTAELDFVHYELEEPKYDTDECRQRGMTYAAPMRVTLRLIVFEVDADTETRSVLDIKEQDVYMGDMPLMTHNGTFIINGTERVIVSQMHRSPGVFFDHDRGKTHAAGKYLFAARVIPYRGSWLDFEFDAKDIVNVRIDRKRKLPVTTLLYALNWNSEEILNPSTTASPGCVAMASKDKAGGEAGWVVPFVEPIGAARSRPSTSSTPKPAKCLPARHQDHAAHRQEGGHRWPEDAADADRGNLWPLFGL